MESIASYLIPRQCLDKLAIGVRSGLAAGYAWLLNGDLVEFWRYADGRTADVRSLRLPNALAHDSNANATLFVSILSYGKGSAVSVLICSSNGCVAAWMDANLFNVEPTLHSLITSSESSPPMIVTSFSAVVPSEASGHQAIFLASAGLSDGSWALLQGSTTQGILSKRINHKPLPPATTPYGTNPSSIPPLLSKLSSALQWGLQEAFDPSARLLRKTPGLGIVSSIQILSVDTTKVRVLVLYESSLDCWQVNLGLRPSELLLWSFCNLTLAQALTVRPRRPGTESRNVSLSNVPSSPLGRCVYIWLTDGEEGRPSHYLQKIILDSSPSSSSALTPVHDWCINVGPMDGCGFKASFPMHLSCQGAGKGDGDGSCLMMAGPGHVLVECWVPNGSREGKGLPQSRLLSDDPDNLALAPLNLPPNPHPSQGQLGAIPAPPLLPAFAVLSTTYGVIELPPPSSSSSSSSSLMTGLGPLSHDQVQQVFQLLDTTCRQALLLRQQHQQRGQDHSSVQETPANSNSNLNLRGWPPLRALVSGLTRRLQSLSAFSPSTNLGVLLKYSSHLCDMTPAAWAQESLTNVSSVGSSVGGVSFLEQLCDKGLRHEALLACLSESGILRGLDPHLQVSLVENQEKVATAHGLLTLQSTLSFHLSSGTASIGHQMVTDNLDLLEGVTARAGLLSSGSNEGQGRVKGVEMFYSQPTLSTPQIFKSLSEASVAITRQFESDPGSKESLLMRSRLSFLSQVLGTTIASCNHVRSIASSQYRMDLGHLYLSLGRPGWWQGPEPRSHIETLLEHIKEAVASSPPSMGATAMHPDPSLSPSPMLFDPTPSIHQRNDLRDLSRAMFGVTEVLFSTHAATVASSPSSHDTTSNGIKPKSTCLSEYKEARRKHAPPLYSQAVSELPPLTSGVGVGVGGYSTLDPDSLMWHLEDLFASHHCYPELFAATRLLTHLLRRNQPPTPLNPALLYQPATTRASSAVHQGQMDVYSRMHACMARMVAEEGAPDRDTFSNHVFQQLLDLGLHSELLSLPMDKFKVGLVAFLQPQPQLLWLLHLLTDEAPVVGSLALGPISQMDKEGLREGLREATMALSRTSDLARQAKDMRSHHRLECLASLSSYADKDPPSSLLHSSRLRLIHIQHKLSSMSGGSSHEDLMTLEETVDLALSLTSGPGGNDYDVPSLLALESLLVCPRHEMESNKERWREAWRHLLMATDWPTLGRDGSRNVLQRVGGGGDEGMEGGEVRREGELGPALMTTPLYLGTLSCGGREAFGFMADGSFNPQRVTEVRGWIKGWCKDLSEGGMAMNQGGLPTTPSKDELAASAVAGRVTRSSRKAQSPMAQMALKGKRVASDVAMDPEEERRAIMELPIAAFELALAQIVA